MSHHIYFASDFHLGVPDYASSLEREKKIIRWLDQISHHATEIYLVGDIFDFWFEYKYVVPRGYIRILGKLAELRDKNISIHIFTGNHDMWMFGYLEQELGIHVYHEPVIREYNQKRFYIGHGDGLGPGDHTYKVIKKIFRNKFFQWCYARLHPNFAFWLATGLSNKSRASHGADDATYKGDDKEWLFQYCKEILEKQPIDYFIFGHRHLPIDKMIGNSRYLNLGDWIQYFTYAYYDGEKVEYKKFEE